MSYPFRKILCPIQFEDSEQTIVPSGMPDITRP
jgi:hypothetical protein